MILCYQASEGGLGIEFIGFFHVIYCWNSETSPSSRLEENIGDLQKSLFCRAEAGIPHLRHFLANPGLSYERIGLVG